MKRSIERCCGSASAVLLLAVLAVTLSSSLSLTVMSVDFGAEFMKVAVVAVSC